MKKGSVSEKNNMVSDYGKMSDEELIARMHERSDEYPFIVDHLLVRHTDLVKKIAGNVRISFSDREDLIQEGMLGLLDAINHYDPSRGASFITFAKLEVRSDVFNALLSQNSKKNSIFLDYISISSDDFSESGNSGRSSDKEAFKNKVMTPEEITLFKELRKQIVQSINTVLTKKERTCLILKMNGVSLKDIALRMEISEKSVENAIARARNKLKISMNLRDDG